MMGFIFNEEEPFKVLLFTEYFLYQIKIMLLEELKTYSLLFSFKKISNVSTIILRPRLEKILIHRKQHNFEKLIQQLCLREGKK